jgi:hypothetical protein
LRITSLWPNELRYAARALRRSPTFALTVVLTLTVTLGINVGVFTTLNALALRRLPAPRPDELVRLSTAFRTGQEVPFSFPMFRELARRQTAVTTLIGWSDSGRTVEVQGVSAMGRISTVTGNYFAELGAVPAAGRLLLPSDVDLEAFTPAAVAVIGHGFWQRHFGGSPAALGATVRIDDVPFDRRRSAAGLQGVRPHGRIRAHRSADGAGCRRARELCECRSAVDESRRPSCARHVARRSTSSPRSRVAVD